jgi:ABC-type oligopeptide transport system ATPase subunit
VANLLEVRDLRVSFGAHEAVRGLSFDIAHGETLALVGESGCGKSATALSLMRLVPTPGRVTGSLRFDGRELLDLPAREIREIRGQQISMIFQEPMTSLNPVPSRPCASMSACPKPRHGSVPSSCSNWCGFRSRSGGCSTFRTSCLAASGNA